MSLNVVESIFNSKNNLYQNFSKINGVNYFDLERKHMHYGRIDFDGDAIYLDDSALKQIFSGVRGTHFAAEFVADAFNDMRVNVRKMANSNFISKTGYFPSHLTVRKSWSQGDLVFSYNAHINKIYTNFVNNYLSVDRRESKVKNYKDFVKSFVEYNLKNAKYWPITRTGYITSIHCSPFVSGLMIEIANERHGVANNMRILNYVSDDYSNYQFFAKQIKKFGFMMDRNAPWRFVFNIASGVLDKEENSGVLKGAQIYLDRYASSYENVLSLSYRKAHLDELLNLKNKFEEMYRSYYLQFPTYEEIKYHKSSSERCFKTTVDSERFTRQPPDIIGMTDEQHNDFMLKILLKLRMLEADVPHDTQQFTNFTREMMSNKRLFGQDSAINFINDLTKGFSVVKFNTRGEYWYGKDEFTYEQTKRDSLEAAANPSNADFSLSGTGNTQ